MLLLEVLVCSRPPEVLLTWWSSAETRAVGVGGGLRRLNVLGLDLAWSDVDRGELREGYDVSISMSMSRSANLEKERGERGQSAGNKRLRAVRLRERAAARSRRPVRRVARVRRVRRRVIC